ncbi:hypothetical protein ES703_103864 [subsurface metagenome]
MGLHRRCVRDRDDDEAQPHVARRDRVPPARAAQCRQGRCFRRGVRPQDAVAGDAGAGRGARDIRSGFRRSRGARSGSVRRVAHAELGVGAGPGEDGASRARRAAFLSALCPRRRCVCRGHGEPQHFQRLCGVLPDGRHRPLQPPRARHRQALCAGKPYPRDRRRLPERAGLAHGETDQGQVQDTARHQGHRHR